MAFSPDGSSLYVADTDNHAIRSIDLATGNVATLAGTGSLGWPPTAGPATEVSLNSPWDLVERDGTLWIAMAGTHQLWSMDLAAGDVGPRVGSAREGTANGPFATAELAQPSGLAFDGEGRLFFADSESSAVRYADVAAAETGLVAGSDANLFDFGDVDGVGDEARLQHPLGVAYWVEGDRVLVADTYNSKIKTIDPTNLSIETFLGLEQGWADGDADAARFFEPGGIDIVGSTMYVADTNNHAIRVVDLPSGDVGTIVIGGIQRFAPPPDDADYRGTILALEDVTVAPGDGEFLLDIRLPGGYKVNEDAPSSVVWSVGGSAVNLPETDHSLTGVKFPVSIPAVFVEGGGEVTADLTVIYCRDDAESLCLIEQIRFTGPVTVAAGGTSSVVFTHEVVVPDL
jgi:DNA-binding beta-propeller fold protein YncE